MDPSDKRNRGSHYRKSYHVAQGVGTAAPFTARHSSDQHIVYRDLAKYHEHESDRDQQRDHSIEMRHQVKEDRLQQRHRCKNGAQGMVINQVSDHQLRERSQRKYQESIPAYQGSAGGNFGQALGKDLGQCKCCTLKD